MKHPVVHVARAMLLESVPFIVSSVQFLMFAVAVEVPVPLMIILFPIRLVADDITQFSEDAISQLPGLA